MIGEQVNRERFSYQNYGKNWNEKNAVRIRAYKVRYRTKHRARLQSERAELRSRPSEKLKSREYTLSQLKTPVGRMKHLVRNAIQRAKKNDLPFDAEFLQEFVVTPRHSCACCGVTFDFEIGIGARKPQTISPSIDKIIDPKGYVRGNVQIICWDCNTRKRDTTADRLRQIVAYIETYSHAT